MDLNRDGRGTYVTGMQAQAATLHYLQEPDTLDQLIEDWLIHLEAENLSPNTLKLYRYSVGQFVAHLQQAGLVPNVPEVTSKDIESFLIAKTKQSSASTAATCYRGLQQFFKWLVEEAEIGESPMARLGPPRVPESPVPVIPEEDLRKLFKTCQSTSFDDRRDAAILRTFLSTGARVGEVAGLRVEDVDLQGRSLYVTGKGRKGRNLPLSPKLTRALSRYLRARSHHSSAASEMLWVGVRGPMTTSGLTQMLRRRCRQAGIGKLHPHQFRHTFTHDWLAKGGNEHDLCKINGWASTQMVGRYAASAATQRAFEAHGRLMPGEDI